MWYNTTYQKFISLLEGDAFPAGLLIGSRNVDLLLLVIPALVHLVQALIMTAAAFTWLRSEAVSAYRVVNLSVLMVVISAESSGYIMIYFMLFTLLEPWKGALRKTAILLCYVQALPLDIPVGSLPEVARETYFGDTVAFISFSVMVGPFVRPLIILIIATCIALETMKDVWMDIRQQGWAARWRFRYDAPLLPWVARPQFSGFTDGRKGLAENARNSGRDGSQTEGS